MRARFAGAIIVAMLVALVPGGDARGAVTDEPPDALGVFDPATATWYLRSPDRTTTAFRFGRPGDVPLVGDWDGDGYDGVGVYRPSDGTVLVRDDLDLPISFAERLRPGAVVTAGDFDGDGVDEIALALGGRLHLEVSATGVGDPLPVLLGGPVDALVAGDFDADGRDEIAALRDGRLEAVIATDGVRVEIGEMYPIAGDWDGDGVDTVGGFHPWTAQFTLYHGLAGRPWPAFVGYGATGMLPVAGDFGPLAGGDDPPPRSVGLPPMTLDESGPHVVMLQEALAARGLYRGPIDGEYGWATAYGVMTLHKVRGLERTWDLEEGDWLHLANFSLPDLPDRPDEPDRVEVDIGRQVLYVYHDHEVVTIVPVSTGGTYAYYSPRNDAVVWAGTPRGDFTLFNYATGWHCDPLTGWCIYNPWSFTPHYALHGYLSVPEYPASHGCVRVTTWDSDLLADYLWVGMPIHIWDAYPVPDPGADDDPEGDEG